MRKCIESIARTPQHAPQIFDLFRSVRFVYVCLLKNAVTFRSFFDCHKANTIHSIREPIKA